MNDTVNKMLSVIVIKPQRVEFSGVAKAVSSINVKGKFDILPYHTNFISLINDSVTIHLDGKDPVVFPLKTGIIKVNEDKVKVLIGIETET